MGVVAYGGGGLVEGHDEIVGRRSKEEETLLVCLPDGRRPIHACGGREIEPR